MNPLTLRSARVDAALLAEVVAGLSAPHKRLPCKLFYDDAGAALFERICRLPEYYPTRTELSILRTHGAAMARWIGAGARVVEFGSGSGEKTRVLLDQLDTPSEYVPIDIVQPQLGKFARSLGAAFPAIAVRPVCADYTHGIELPHTRARTIVFFPGSTVGNFEPAEALAFLRNAARLAGKGGGLLIGVDLRKARATLERAYNDAAGVTAAFNLNMLSHINRVCAGDFDPAQFEHRAVYNEKDHRIEMYLVSRVHQRVRVGAKRIGFAAGEAVLTEYSYKYDVASFQSLGVRAGFTPRAVWTDAALRFSVHAFDASC
ncbi:MAG: L-histidine N(alpha)-methyltransferase [Gemmatimonadota bacterium]